MCDLLLKPFFIAQHVQRQQQSSNAPARPVFKVLLEKAPRAPADGLRQRLDCGEGASSVPCFSANVSEAFAHGRRAPEYRYRVVWVKRKVIFRRLLVFFIARSAISDERAPIQVAHGLAEKPSPLLLQRWIPTMVGFVVHSKSQHSAADNNNDASTTSRSLSSQF